MGATAYQSDQYQAAHGAPSMLSMEKYDKSLKAIAFKVTQTAKGDAGSTLLIGRLPAGKLVFHPALSRYRWTAGGASLVFDIGYAAYTKSDGDAATADADCFDNDVDVSSAGAAFMGSDIGTNGTGGDTVEFDSKDGVTIYITSAGAVIPAAMTVIGNLVYSQP